MRLTCKEPGCGTIIQTGDNDSELITRLMANHVSAQHSTLEARHASTLTKCLAAFNLLAAGGKFGKAEARDLQGEISNLLGVPFAPGEKENDPVSSVVSQPVAAGADGADSHVPVAAEAVPAVDDDHPGV